jgi:protein TonB
MNHKIKNALISILLLTSINPCFCQEKKSNIKKETIKVELPPEGTSDDTFEESNLVVPKKDEDNIIEFPEIEPVFQGDSLELTEWIKKNLIYPKEAIEEGIEGKVPVSFIINENGTISSPVIVRRLSPECDREAIRLVKSMPNWIPGKTKNKVVKVRKTIIVIFNSENQTN